MFLYTCKSPAPRAQDFSSTPAPHHLPSPWCVCREEVSCHSFCLPEVVSVLSVLSILQISQQLPEELRETTGSVMRNSLCSHRAGQPLSTQRSQGSRDEGEEKANAAEKCRNYSQGPAHGWWSISSVGYLCLPSWAEMPGSYIHNSQVHVYIKIMTVLHRGKLTQRQLTWILRYHVRAGQRFEISTHFSLPGSQTNTLSMLDVT